MSKFFVFDRDDTLINESGNLINSESILSLISTINSNDHAQWAIASAGATALEEDDAYKAIRKKLAINDFKKPKYIQFSHSLGYLNALKHLDFDYIKNNSNREALDLLREALIEIMNSDEISDKIVLNNNGLIKLPNDPCVIFELGQTKIFFNLNTLHQNRKLLHDGHWKLFMIIKALDEAGKKLDLVKCPELRELGITEIQSPRDHEVIAAKDVVFCDDREGCCELARQAGFTAIRVDAIPNEEKPNVVNPNAYLEQLAEQAAELKIENVRKAIIEGIKRGDFKTGYLGTTGKAIKCKLSTGNILTTKVPSGIQELLETIDKPEIDPTAKLLEMQKIAQEHINRHQKSGLFFHRPEAAQRLYNNLINSPSPSSEVRVGAQP